MKKILFASTALVASAGVAAADVTLGGDGYFGVAYGGVGSDGIFVTTAEPIEDDGTQDPGDRSEYAFVYDLDFDFTGSGESDSGLVFGASADADEIDTSQGAIGFDTEIFVSGTFGTLALGDTDGGAEAVIGDLTGVGITGLGDFNENIFLLGAGASPAGPLALYTYDFAGFSFALGLSDDQGYSIGLGYAGSFNNGGYSVGIAYENVQEGAIITVYDPDVLDSNAGFDSLDVVSTDDLEHVIGQASVSFAGFGIKGVYGTADAGEVDLDQYGVGLDYSFDAVTLGAYYRRLESDGLDDEAEIDQFGFGASYDLGGGLAIGGGIAVLDDGGALGGDEEDTDGVNSLFDDELVVADFGFTFDF